MNSASTDSVVSRRLLYIRALKAVLPSVLEIIDDVPHVAIYRFHNDKKQWSRLDIEGSAYVTRNAQSPFYSLIVLNKKGETDFVMHIQQEIEKIRVQENYLMVRCRGEEQPVYGIWIHQDAERQRLFESLSGVLAKTSDSPSADFLSKINGLRNGHANANAGAAASPAAPAIASTGTSNNNNKAMALLSALKKSSPAPTDPVPAAAPANKSAALLSALRGNCGASSASAPPLPSPPVPATENNNTAAANRASLLLLSALRSPSAPAAAPATERETKSSAEREKEKEREGDLLTDAQIASRVKSSQSLSISQPTQPTQSSASRTQSRSSSFGDAVALSQSAAAGKTPSHNAPTQREKNALKSLLISPSMLQG